MDKDRERWRETKEVERDGERWRKMERGGKREELGGE